MVLSRTRFYTFAALQLGIGVLLLWALYELEVRISAPWIRETMDVVLGGAILGLFFTGSLSYRSYRKTAELVRREEVGRGTPAVKVPSDSRRSS